MVNNKNKILEQIFSKPTYRFHIRELSKITKLNPNTIINITKKLEEEKVIKTERRKNLREIFANIDSSSFIIRKRLFNLSFLYSSGLVEFLIKNYEPEAISVIGSYSKGEDIEKSDIDLVIISKKKQRIDIEKYEKVLDKKIHLLPLEYKEMSEEFYINFINGTILYGYINKK
jgi:predicted nucleotidyltransferase